MWNIVLDFSSESLALMFIFVNFNQRLPNYLRRVHRRSNLNPPAPKQMDSIKKAKETYVKMRCPSASNNESHYKPSRFSASFSS